jgi:hypothetical protein
MGGKGCHRRGSCADVGPTSLLYVHDVSWNVDAQRADGAAGSRRPRLQIADYRLEIGEMSTRTGAGVHVQHAMIAGCCSSVRPLGLDLDKGLPESKMHSCVRARKSAG